MTVAAIRAEPPLPRKSWQLSMRAIVSGQGRTLVGDREMLVPRSKHE
jgi:hypothetical protein